MIEILFGENAAAALLAWVAWNVIIFSFHKDEDEAHFNVKSYCLDTYDNWLASLVSIPVLLILGAKGFNFKQFNLVDGIDFDDFYYMLSGFAVEALKVAYKKFKTKGV